MSMPSPYDIVNVEHFTTGTVGRPGARAFFLQCGGDASLVTVRCEKQHVEALVEALVGALRQLPSRPLGTLPVDLSLREPLEPAFVVGGIGLGYDEQHDRVLLLLEPFVAPDDEAQDQPEPPAARWVLTREQATAFIPHATTLVKGGRPTCPLCERPIDPDGHTCIKTNGHRPH